MALTKVTQTVIATGAISSSQIANGSITADHLTGVNTDHVSEGSTNVYFSNARARSSLSGSTGVTYDSSTGAISIGQAVGTSDSVAFGQVAVDNITINGSTISSASSMVLDVVGNLTVNVDGTTITLADDAINFGQFYNNASGQFNIKSPTQDKDIVFLGNDGGSTITALTLDMSSQGDAIFNNDILLGDGNPIRFGDDQDLRMWFDGNHGIIQNTTSNSDIYIKGNDGGSTITMLNFDTSNLGKATFSGDIITPGSIAASSDASQIQLGSGNRAQIFHNSAGLYMRTSTGPVYAQADSFRHMASDASTDYLVSTSTALTVNSGLIKGPSTLTIDPAAHGDNTGTVVIAGDLQVDGTTTTINSTTVNVDDLNIQLATGAANAAAADGAGITVDGASATITYDGTNDEWDFNKGINVTGTVTADGLTLSQNHFIQMGGAGEFQIFNDGSNTVLRSSDNFLIQRDTSPRTSIKVTDSSGEVELSYAGSPKLATTSSGINVTGAVVSSANGAITTANGTTARFTVNETGGAITAMDARGSTGNIGTRSNHTLGFLVNDVQRATLSVGGDFTVTNDIKVTTTNPRIDYDGGNTGALRFYSTSAAQERMRVTSGGNVGIGTDNPRGNLEIESTGVTNLYLTRNDSTINNTNSLGVINFSGTEDGSTYINGAQIYAKAEVSWSAGDYKTGLTFSTNLGNSLEERMRIGYDGKVYFGNQDNAASAGYIDKQTSGDYEFKIHASTSTTTDRAITFHNRSNTEAMRIDSSGHVGIGQNNPGVKLEIGENSSSTNVGYIRLRGHNTLEGNIYKDATYGLHFDTNSNIQPIRIDGSKQILGITGNVGIGTEDPTLKLDLSSSSSFGLPGTSGTTPVGFARIGYTDRTWGGNEILMGIINASANNYAGYIQCKVPTDYSVARPFLINPQGGNVGIGTSSTAALLHVEGGAPTGVAKDTYTTVLIDETESRLQIRSDNSGSDGSILGLSTGGHNWAVHATAGNTYSNSLIFGYLNSSSDGNVLSSTTQDAKMIVRTNGNVGVGIDPSYRFHAYHPTTNVVGKFESGDSQVWIDLHDSGSGNYGALLGHDGTFDFMVANDAVTQMLSIRRSSSMVELGDGYGIVAEDGRSANVTITTSFTTVLNMSSLGTGNSRGFYLVTVVRDGGSVGTNYIALIGASSTSNSYVYEVLTQNSLAGQMSGSNLQIRLTSGTSAEVHTTCVPIGIHANDS